MLFFLAHALCDCPSLSFSFIIKVTEITKWSRTIQFIIVVTVKSHWFNLKRRPPNAVKSLSDSVNSLSEINFPDNSGCWVVFLFEFWILWDKHSTSNGRLVTPSLRVSLLFSLNFLLYFFFLCFIGFTFFCKKSCGTNFLDRLKRKAVWNL